VFFLRCANIQEVLTIVSEKLGIIIPKKEEITEVCEQILEIFLSHLSITKEDLKDPMILVKIGGIFLINPNIFKQIFSECIEIPQIQNMKNLPRPIAKGLQNMLKPVGKLLKKFVGKENIKNYIPENLSPEMKQTFGLNEMPSWQKKLLWFFGIIASLGIIYFLWRHFFSNKNLKYKKKSKKKQKFHKKKNRVENIEKKDQKEKTQEKNTKKDNKNEENLTEKINDEIIVETNDD
jgi:hypothetical protein